MSENNTRAGPAGWTLSVWQAKLDRGSTAARQANAKSPARRTGGSSGWMLLSKRGVTMARVLIGGRRGVVVRGGGLGGMVLGLVLRRVVRQQARRRALR